MGLVGILVALDLLIWLSFRGWSVLLLAPAVAIVAAAFAGDDGLTHALDALGDTYLQIARTMHIGPALMHRIAVIGSGTLDSLPHNGAVVTLLAVCGSIHRKSYFRHGDGQYRWAAHRIGRRYRFGFDLGFF